MRIRDLGILCVLRASVTQLFNAATVRHKNGFVGSARLIFYLITALSLSACGTVWPPSVPDVDLAEGEKLRFVVMGDSGSDTDIQEKVSEAVKEVCGHLGGCHFALMLGDNIYPSGAERVSDLQFCSKFECPYEDLDFPFFMALGNHDYGGRGIGYEFWKGQVQIDYTNHTIQCACDPNNPDILQSFSGKWKMPAHHYRFKVEDANGTPLVAFFAIDTNSIYYRNPWLQRWWLSHSLARSSAKWKIVYGHHTFLSNGQHGNAGNYENVGNLPLPPDVPTSIVDGQPIKEFFDEVILGKVHLYLAGHDHNRQWLVKPECHMDFIVSGNASRRTDLKHWDTNQTIHESDQGGGFVLMEVSSNSSMSIKFFSENPGNPPMAEFSGTLSHTIPAGCS